MEETQHDHTNANADEQTDDHLSEFIKHLRRDSDISGLSLPDQKQLWNRIDRNNKRHDRRFVRRLVWSGSVAASITLILLAGWYAFSPLIPAENVEFFSMMKSFESKTDNSGDVQLMLSNNRTITIEGEEAQLDYSEEGWVDINNSEQREATADKADEKTVFNQLVVPAGKRSKLILSDGTQVWINSASKVFFPVNFGTKTREVFVEGEIYLDVIPEVERPFIVHTKAIDVKVLGTKFNVSAYDDQPDLQIALVSGEVEILENGDSKERLKPYQMFSYNAESHDYYVSTVDVMDYIAWKDGYYVFKSQELGDVFTKLSKYYNVQFNWAGQVKRLVCSGKLDLKEDLQAVLNSLEKAVLSIEIQKISEKEYSVIVKP